MTDTVEFQSRSNLHRLIYFFCALALFVNPLMEAPKNASMGLLLVISLICEIKYKTWTRFGAWDVFFLLFILSYFVGVPLGSYPTKFGVVTDVLRYTLFGWVIYRTNFSEQQRIGLVFWATLGTVVGLIYGAWDFYWLKNGQFWTLNSVGHVNHAAIYDAIATCMALVTLVVYWSVFTVKHRAMWLVMFLICLSYILLGESRATFGAVLAVFFVLGLFYARKKKTILLGLVAVIAVIVALAVTSGVRVVKKQEFNESQDNILSYRDTIWQAGMTAFKAHPLFGLGKENFRHVPISGPGFENGVDHASHAHNVYINNLVEGGIWGFGWLMALFAGVVISLLRSIPGKTSVAAHWANWGWCVSGLGITLIVGLVNTTLHHEHGNLTMFSFALWLSASSLLPRKA